MLTFTHVIDSHRVSVMFTGKPPEAIRAMLKGHGFRWSPVGGFWWRARVKGFADFLAALDHALNPDKPHKPDGACWRCNSPEGFFRPYGASTPVYCEACHRFVREYQKATGYFPPDSMDRFNKPAAQPGHPSAAL